MSKTCLLKQQNVNEHTPINLCVFYWHNINKASRENYWAFSLYVLSFLGYVSTEFRKP